MIESSDKTPGDQMNNKVIDLLLTKQINSLEWRYCEL